MRRTMLHVLIVAGLLLQGCAANPAQPVAAPPHHTADGFRNLHEEPALSRLKLLQWLLLRMFSPAREHDAAAVPQVAVDPARLKVPPAALRATWLGHATVLLQSGSFNLLTDPVFSERASPLTWIGPKRRTPLPLSPADLPTLDAVLISHNHYDHLDIASLRALARQDGGEPLFIVPLGNARLLRAHGLTRIRELDWWQSLTLGTDSAPLQVTLVPVQHWSGRGLTDRNRSLWGGHVVQHQGRKMFFAGDTGYSPGFRELAARYGHFDLAMLPIGAYEPRAALRRQHLNPDDAVRIHRELNARISMGIHWGVFTMTDELLQQPPLDLAEARRRQGVHADAFPVWAIGESRELP